MSVFDLLKLHKQAVISNGGTSVPCILTSFSAQQGKGATLTVDDPDYDSLDSLNCIANFIGLDISTDTGMGVVGDSAQAILNLDDIKIGVPEENWKITIYFPMIGKFIKFKIENSPIDRTQGICLLKLTCIKDYGQGKKVKRQGLGAI